MAQASAAANRIISLRPLGDGDSQGHEHLEDTEGGASIEFKSVHFSYPTRDVPVFKNLSLSVSEPHGEDYPAPAKLPTDKA